MNGEEFMEQTRTLVKLAELEFFDTECKKCMGTSLQKKRNCSKLDGWYFSCSKQNKFIEEKTKKENGENFAKFFSEFRTISRQETQSLQDQME